MGAVRFKRAASWCICVGLGLLAALPREARPDEEFSFDASAFEKRSFEFRGFAELWPEYLRSNTDGALYQLAFAGEEGRREIVRGKAALELEGRFTKGIATLLLRGRSDAVWDYRGRETEHRLLEGLASLQPKANLSLFAGKKAYRWGKGAAWNPVGFVERPKDPNDPTESREGFWTAGLDWIRSFDGALKTVALTPLVVPTVTDLNAEFGEPGHLNFAAKLYLLYRDTDLDFMLLGNGSRSARYGVDFSRNLAPNFEVHGEFAYITDFQRTEISTYPTCRTTKSGIEDVVSYLLGLRYRTERDVSYTLEYYFNGTGNSERQQRRFYDCVHAAWERGDESLLQRLSQPSGPFVKPNPMQRYLQMRVVWNEPADILYLAPGVQAFYNLDDHSLQVAPQVVYTGIENLELFVRVTVPVGGTGTEWGEKANDYKLDFRVRYYF